MWHDHCATSTRRSDEHSTAATPSPPSPPPPPSPSPSPPPSPSPSVAAPCCRRTSSLIVVSAATACNSEPRALHERAVRQPVCRVVAGRRAIAAAIAAFAAALVAALVLAIAGGETIERLKDRGAARAAPLVPLRLGHAVDQRADGVLHGHEGRRRVHIEQQQQQPAQRARHRRRVYRACIAAAAAARRRRRPASRAHGQQLEQAEEVVAQRGRSGARAGVRVVFLRNLLRLDRRALRSLSDARRVQREQRNVGAVMREHVENVRRRGHPHGLALGREEEAEGARVVRRHLRLRVVARHVEHPPQQLRVGLAAGWARVVRREPAAAQRLDRGGLLGADAADHPTHRVLPAHLRERKDRRHPRRAREYARDRR
eukprot:6680429-Prymnesium_polylepis.1